MSTRTLTDVQAARMAELESAGITCYPLARQGRTIVDQFRRFCQTGDPAKIGEGLYHFSVQGAGGLNEIAHCNIHGFRSVYWTPERYVELLEYERGRGITHSAYVCTDGMTYQEVRADVYAIADNNRGIIQRQSALAETRSRYQAS